MCSGSDGLGLGSGMLSDSCEARSSASVRFVGSSGRGKLTSSCVCAGEVVSALLAADEEHNALRREEGTHLEALRVPPLDLLDAGHLVQAMRKLVELLDAVREADRELCGEELGGAEEGALDDGNSSASACAGRRETATRTHL